MQISFSPHISSIYILYKANFATCSFSCDGQRRDLTSVLTYTQQSQLSSSLVKTSYHPTSLFCPPCNQPSLHVLWSLKHGSHFRCESLPRPLDVSQRGREKERGR